MTATTDFIAELIRAANEVKKLTDPERRELMVHAILMVREMRVEIGIRPGSGRDVLFKIEVAALRPVIGSDEEVKAMLLELADTIRTLKIVRDWKDV